MSLQFVCQRGASDRSRRNHFNLLAGGMRRGCLVVKATRLQDARPRNLSSIPGCAKKCIHYQRVNNNRGSFLGVKWRWYEDNHSLHIVLKLRMTGATPPLPLYLHDVDRNMSTLNEKVRIREREVRNFLLTTGSRPAFIIIQSSIPFGSFFIRGKGDWMVKLCLNYPRVRVLAMSLWHGSTYRILMQVASVFFKTVPSEE